MVLPDCDWAPELPPEFVPELVPVPVLDPVVVVVNPAGCGCAVVPPVSGLIVGGGGALRSAGALSPWPSVSVTKLSLKPVRAMFCRNSSVLAELVALMLALKRWTK